MPAAAALTVRAATPDDVGLIVSLITELAEYERARERAVATPELIREHLFGGGSSGEVSGARAPIAGCLIGELGGEPCGFAVYFHNFSTWLGRPGLYLEDLFVRPSARGRGLGKALLVRLAAVAVERGCGRMEWAVLDWNTPAIEFYRSLGAAPMDEWTTYRVEGEGLARLASMGNGQ